MSDLPARLLANAECDVITAPKELLTAAAARITELVAENERLRATFDDAADLIKRQQGWQTYGEQLERNADATMAEEIQKQRRKNALLRRALAEAVEVMRPLARLEVPNRPQGNAGAYSIRHVEIEAARRFIQSLESK